MRWFGGRAGHAAGRAERHGRDDAVTFGAGRVGTDLVRSTFGQERPMDDEPHIHQHRNRGDSPQADLQHEVRHSDRDGADDDLRACGDDHGCGQARLPAAARLAQVIAL